MRLRPAEEGDFEFFMKLKSEAYNIFWTGGSEKPEYEKLHHFFCDAVNNAPQKQARKIYIIENENGEPVGHIYIIPNGEEYELSVAVMEKYCGRGYAKKAITLGLAEGKRLGFRRMVTSIREDNAASMKAYTSCGAQVLSDYREVYIPGLQKKVKMYFVRYEY